ncbi:MAG: VOC family protein [Oscillospiraceae bacterium]|nr:VOC family protein [Oscillospiraceae bacterium]
MLIPTISFQGNCDEAINYYKETLDAKAENIAYLKDSPKEFLESPELLEAMGGNLPPNFVTYSEVTISDTLLCMTDGGEKPITGDFFSMMLAFDSADEVTATFEKLSKDGKVVQPLAKQFWADLCGDVVDKFGINWHICTESCSASE